MKGDVSKVSVMLDPDTCEVVIREVVENPSAWMFNNPEYAAAQSDTVYNWRVESEARVKGLAVETLTLTTSWVEFKTNSFVGGGPVFEGSGGSGCKASESWGYNLDQCYKGGPSLSGPDSIWVSALGIYSNDNFESFGHYTYVSSKGLGYENGVDRFETECYGDSLPMFPAYLDCNTDWEFLGMK